MAQGMKDYFKMTLFKEWVRLLIRIMMSFKDNLFRVKKKAWDSIISQMEPVTRVSGSMILEMGLECLHLEMGIFTRVNGLMD